MTTRQALELRPITIESNVLQGGHDGSCIFSFGPVKALAAISGPSEVRIRDERTNEAALQVYCTPLQGVASGTSSVNLESCMEKLARSVLLLHQFPRSLVQIHLQAFSSPSSYVPRPLRPDEPYPTSLATQIPHPDAPISVSLKAAYVNAFTCACLDAGGSLGMRALVAGSSAAIVPAGLRQNLRKGWLAGDIAPTPKESSEKEYVHHVT